MKKNILILLVGLIAGTTLTVGAAYVYTARDINYQPSDENWEVSNVQEAISELKTDVNTITNKVEGIERVYKAGEVELVALVSDDSFYTDSNGKYVLSNSDTGRTLLADTSTYKSLTSTEDTRGEVGADTCSPFKGGLEDIDPERTLFLAFTHSIYKDPYNPAITRSKYVIKGYKKISVASGQIIQTNPNYDYSYIEFFDKNNNSVGKHRFTTNISANTYTDWLDIPNGTYYAYIQLRMDASCYSYLSLLA